MRAALRSTPQPFPLMRVALHNQYYMTMWLTGLSATTMVARSLILAAHSIPRQLQPVHTLLTLGRLWRLALIAGMELGGCRECLHVAYECSNHWVKEVATQTG